MQESDKTLGFSSGGDDYLSKPFSYNELTTRVKALLRRYYVYQGKAEHQEKQDDNIVYENRNCKNIFIGGTVPPINLMS